MPQAYFIRKAYFTLRSNISLVPLGTNFIEKDDCRSNRLFLVGAGGFGPPKRNATDLQSAPFGHSGTLPDIHIT